MYDSIIGPMSPVRKPLMTLRQIPRVSRLSASAFEERYLRRGEPVVLEDAAKDWPAKFKWTFDYLNDVCGQRVVPLRSIDPGRRGSEVQSSETKLKDFLARLARSKGFDPYLSEQPLGRVLPEIVGDVGIIRYSPGSANKLKIMLSANSIAPLHYHSYDEAVSHQIVGERRFVLIPPSETSKLDPLPALGPLANFARRSWREDELKTAQELMFDAMLRPGEAIYIPPHWWHTVYAGGELSILLVDFFRFQRSPPLKTEVSARLELLRDACSETVKDCLTSLQESLSDGDKAVCFDLLIKCYSQLGYAELERKSLQAAIASLPRERQKANWLNRLYELQVEQ